MRRVRGPAALRCALATPTASALGQTLNLPMWVVQVPPLPGLIIFLCPECRKPSLCAGGFCISGEIPDDDGNTVKTYSCSCQSSYAPTVNLDGNVQCMPGTLLLSLTFRSVAFAPKGSPALGQLVWQGTDRLQAVSCPELNCMNFMLMGVSCKDRPRGNRVKASTYQLPHAFFGPPHASVQAPLTHDKRGRTRAASHSRPLV